MCEAELLLLLNHDPDLHITGFTKDAFSQTSNPSNRIAKGSGRAEDNKANNI